MIKFRKVQQNRMYEEIVDQIMETISRGDLKAGDKLPSEKELSQAFGVSRGTIREAILSMEQLGVVEVRQGSTGGAFVKEVDLVSVGEKMGQVLRMAHMTILQLAEARSVLEGTMIARLLPGRIKPSDFEKLTDNLAAAEDHFRAGRFEERLATNFRFHHLLAEFTGNSLMVLLLQLILDLQHHFYRKVKSSAAMVRKTLTFHREIVRLMQAGDFTGAGEVCITHIMDTSSRIAEKSKQQSRLTGDNAQEA